MNDQPPTPDNAPSEPTDTPAEASGEPDETIRLQKLHRTVHGLLARVDQQSEELEAINALMLVIAFACGALAGIVFLQGRQIKELTGALAG